MGQGMFEAATEKFLAELEELGCENDRLVSERRYKMLNLERPTAELIWLLLQSTRRRSVPSPPRTCRPDSPRR